MFSLIVIQRVIVQNNEWLLIVLCHKFHNWTRRRTTSSKSKLLIWSDHHSLFEIKFRLIRNLTNLILKKFLIRVRSMTRSISLWLVSSIHQMLFDSSLIMKIVDFFWWISREIKRFWRNSLWNVYKNWRISEMLELLLNE
jgi:hypothetical protein